MTGREAVILRASGRVPRPWKNGGGSTREVAVYPPGSDLSAFDWRVSMAEVRDRGPFSVFPGVDRCLAVLEGRLILKVENQADAYLTPQCAPLAFPGDVPAFAEPDGGAVSDLNVMTRRAGFTARMWRSSAIGSAIGSAGARPAQTTTLIVALAPLRVRAGGMECSLVQEDALLVEPPLEYEVRPGAPSAAAYFVIEVRSRTVLPPGHP